MHYLTQVQKGIEFIEANLDDDILLHQVATKAGISQWHFQRIFKALTNETLKTYIRSRRLSIALERLLTTDKKIIEIENPKTFERQDWIERLSMSHWNFEELSSGQAWRHIRNYV